mmetsp:Transcript_23045/g.33685  ORF Transcript_23045/g.33685 Transcript_23045/m.33685 type:complete len:291 (+) Transcript_23045:256-1128(+)|eukprot:CAMPEP_0195507332 /NCGR_PEP_ID=MMETSP0794_2-20130614/803_1 /TAXON_ID=515487 /ORGANISM="Stephanopyxis turris, Strain CCMP 815" /LENGTH=290 /DNA_ID=CAMNT_0040633979 /DNA_START=256 /DNA_END=1128 /DNA_ORIENTATION=-
MSASSKFFASKGGFTTKILLARLKHVFDHHPIASNSLLCLNLWAAGDILAQFSEKKLLHNSTGSNVVETKGSAMPQRQQKTEASPSVIVGMNDKNNKTASEKETTINYIRTAQCAFFGATVTGPILAVWYPFLDKICVAKNVTLRYGIWGAPVAKVVADEFLMDPPSLVLFYSYMNACEGGSLETLKHKLDSEFMVSWLTSLAVWPWVLLGTFRFLPVYAQAPLINVCCVVWDGFLSHRNAVSRVKEKEMESEAEEAGRLKARKAIKNTASAYASESTMPVKGGNTAFSN